MSPKLKAYIGDKLIGVADLSDASIIMGEVIQPGADLNTVGIIINDSVKVYAVMAYTTSLNTLKLIFQNMTIRSSSLEYAMLNDQMEKERVGVSQFAGNRFITCFCHQSQEQEYFWKNYVKDDKGNKVCLQFKNFASDFQNCFYTDYGLVKDDKRCAFGSRYWGKLVNKQMHPDEEVKKYDLMKCVETISMFDVEYVPKDSSVFTDDNSGSASVDFAKYTGSSNSKVELKGFDPTVLGKQKSEDWKQEHETRILCDLGGDQFHKWDYIDLRLKPEIFRNLKIILSPWDDGSLKKKVEEIINTSSIPEDVKASIAIVDSSMKGTI